MKIQFKRKVTEGSIIGFWYGVAWHDPNRRVAVCYPLPFNLIFGFVRDQYWRLKLGRCPDILDKIKGDAFDMGHRSGRYNQAERFKARIKSLIYTRKGDYVNVTLDLVEYCDDVIADYERSKRNENSET